jgi:hypothetical protein
LLKVQGKAGSSLSGGGSLSFLIRHGKTPGNTRSAISHYKENGMTGQNQ